MAEYPNFGGLDDWGDLDLEETDDDFLAGLDVEALIKDLTGEKSQEETTRAGDEERNKKAPTFVNVDTNEKTNFVESMKNQNTIRKTEQCVRQFNRFLAENNESREPWEIDPVKLDPLLGTFLLSIRKNDGTEYEPDTLTSYHRGIDRALREHGYAKSLVTDREFAPSRAVLAAKRKELKAKGKGNKPNAAEPLSTKEEGILRDKGCTGIDTPDQLLNQLWLNNTILFGLRGGKENHQLRWGDVSLKQDESGREYVQFNERLTKTRTGEVAGGNQRSFMPKQYAHLNPDTCPVRVYKEYARRRPARMCDPESPFYLAVNRLRKPGSGAWFKCQPLGENNLRNIMPKMAEDAGLPGRKTSHSARKTTCTRLLHAGVPPTEVQQLSGHKCLGSVNGYAVASIEQQQNMSDILSGNQENSSKVMNTPQPLNANAFEPKYLPQNQVDPARHLIQNSSLTNCTVNFYNSACNETESQAGQAPRRKKFKRIRIIESDSDSD